MEKSKTLFFKTIEEKDKLYFELYRDTGLVCKSIIMQDEQGNKWIPLDFTYELLSWSNIGYQIVSPVDFKEVIE